MIIYIQYNTNYVVLIIIHMQYYIPLKLFVLYVSLAGFLKNISQWSYKCMYNVINNNIHIRN